MITKQLNCVYAGQRFDISAFHHQILRLGPVPMNILEEEIRRWMALANRSYSNNVINTMALLFTVMRTCVIIQEHVLRIT